MKVNGIAMRTIWPSEDHSSVQIIDQSQLPHELVIKTITTWKMMIDAIKTMKVRGAPLIGISGAWGLYLAVKENDSEELIEQTAKLISQARPTAVNLVWAINHMKGQLLEARAQDRRSVAFKIASEMTQADVMTNRAIGEHGKKIIAALYQEKHRPINILTHCNAGWLATVDYGTALAPVYRAFEEGVPLHLFVDETRPRNQGLLTAWECAQQGVPYTVIADNAGGQLMQQGEIDMVIVGADRITKRGDVANKVGTYLKALAAKDNDIPFYVAAPLSTVDWTLNDGKREIEIEQRNATELSHVRGVDAQGKLSEVQILTPEQPVANPAFDVTHNRFVTKIITEQGVFSPEDLSKLQRDC